MMDGLLAFSLALFTGVLAYATWQLVFVNRELLEETKTAAQAAMNSADAARLAAEAAAKNAQIAEREFFLSHRSYVLPVNFSAEIIHDTVFMYFEVKDIAGVPTYVKSVKTRTWEGDLEGRPNVGMSSHPIVMDIYRDYGDRVTVHSRLPGTVETDWIFWMDIEIEYIDSASGDMESWEGTAQFSYRHRESQFANRLFKGARQNRTADT